MSNNIPANAKEYRGRYNELTVQIDELQVQIDELQVKRTKMMESYADANGAYPIGSILKCKKFEYKVEKREITEWNGRIRCYICSRRTKNGWGKAGWYLWPEVFKIELVSLPEKGESNA